MRAAVLFLWIFHRELLPILATARPATFEACTEFDLAYAQISCLYRVSCLGMLPAYLFECMVWYWKMWVQPLLSHLGAREDR